jgi:hypothetical protein
MTVQLNPTVVRLEEAGTDLQQGGLSRPDAAD